MVGAAVHIVFLYAALIDVHFLWFVGVDTEGTGIGYLFFKGTCGQTVIQIAYCVTAIAEVSVTVLVWGVGGEQIDQTPFSYTRAQGTIDASLRLASGTDNRF